MLTKEQVMKVISANINNEEFIVKMCDTISFIDCIGIGACPIEDALGGYCPGYENVMVL